ncbi:subtilase family protein [Acetobacteroides hydrogenigenes]|uniref:Subtilase family protein n=2 Tax=Acetobacteroides hydrogenigenes TaxID=979970 RepID=A0A4V2RQP1_9BACT|nr:subtilase family protein [Acetobacteroides hydrogenigenes]
MRKYLIFLIVILTFTNGFSQNGSKHYYYYNNEKKYLELNSDYVFVSFTGSDAKQINELRKFGLTKYQKESASSKLKQKLNEIEDFYWAEIKLGENISIESYTQKISELKKVENIKVVSPYFKSANSKKIGLSNSFYVKIKTLSDTLLLQQYAKRHNAVIDNQDTFMPLWFTLSCTKNTSMNALELANKFYESGMFQYAEPDLMLDNILNSVDDTYFTNQWGLRNTGQYQGTSGIDIKALEAWNMSIGSGVNVAVVDHGIQLDHPDLQANIHSLSYDTENDSSPSIVRGDHATACAGIIGAIGNTAGIRGVSPNCKLMSVSSTLDLMTPDIRKKMAKGINWATQNGAHIISNSWGHNDLTSNYIDDAITNAITNGRNGLGCVVIFASGNDNGQVNYPANSNPNILTVGAISPCGQRKNPSSCDGENWGSNYGPTLDVVAPGVLISTTDRTSSNGYNPSMPIHTGNGGNKVTSDYSNMDYTVWFNGTSAACPHVAGVAALILSVNPSLTGQQVRDIIEQTAQKVGGYPYSTTPG